MIVEEPSSEPRESHPANLVSLRTQAASLRDQILRIEKEEEVKGTLNSRRSTQSSDGKIAFTKATEKLRKKLAEVEANLVLASPNLVFQVILMHILLNIILKVSGLLGSYSTVPDVSP